MLLETIKVASVNARKSRSPNAAFLVTLYSEAATVGKNKRNGSSTDEEVISVLKKFKTNAETMIQAALKQNSPRAQQYIDEANLEISIINQYLPKTMTEEELRAAIEQIVSEIGDLSSSKMGLIMTQLKTKFPGLYDGALASNLVKARLVGL